MRLCTLGDLLLDVTVRLAGPLNPGADARAETRLGAGGQAANVAAWAASLGADVRFVGKRADDEAGRIAVAELAAQGVDVVGPVVEGRTGVVVALVGPDGDRTMASDRGVAPDLRPDELALAWFADREHLHLSGYILLREPGASAAVRAARAMRSAGGRLSVDLASWAAIRDYGAERLLELLRTLGPDVVFATERERETLGGDLRATWVLKRGAEGFAVSGEAWPALAVEAIDATGAGDALAAGFLVGGAGLAAEAAARCVGKVGAMP
jgi:sugar/nucleoside kinase (ribokinase family)